MQKKNKSGLGLATVSSRPKVNRIRTKFYNHNMYDNKTAEKMKSIAGNAMDSAQLKIDQLNALGSNNRNMSSSFLLEWQKWIATISFSLVAIGGAFLAQGKMPNGYLR